MTMTDPSDAAPPGSPPKPLTRSRDCRMIAGVAGGLAQYLGIDPVIVRIVFVVLTVAGGSGVVLYGLGWLLIPEEGGERTLDLAGVPRGTLLVIAACGLIL
ncbi:MAG TPA: PspC domain-containing protein, partial [Acidimicrobiales bacterium]|nr:PspC domain-containing protein [Acidimicrobiales bacterium]